MQAELIGIICTIGKLFSMDNFRWADSIHVHHVDNMEACITANRLQALMAVLNRCANELCREVQIAAMNRHVREYDPRERENVDRLEIQARI